MAQPSAPPNVTLICGMISAREELLDRAIEALTDAFGPVETVSETFPFDLTHYYDAEMGSPLHRRFVSFAERVDPSILADAKRRTNAIEERFARECSPPPRPVNLDVGYVESSKLVLASMKNFSHRIYLSGGVYAEVTLLYRKGRWQALEWTFPDFASGRYDGFLSLVRGALRARATQRETGA